MTFMLLCGETPFGGRGGDNESMKEARDNILAGRYDFEPEEYGWDRVSEEAKDFVRKLLVTDPELRPSAEQAQLHPWIRAYHEKTTNRGTVHPKVVQSLVSFKNLPITKRLLFEVVSFTMLPIQIRSLKREFEKIDTEGLGEISLACMNQVLTRSAVGHNGLTKPEIREIFDTMKVGKAEPRVHWHEFIAACLPECDVDDRNLLLAFDRLDQDHKGFITSEEVIQLIARDANENEDALRKTWAESAEEYHLPQSKFSYDDFRRLVCRCPVHAASDRIRADYFFCSAVHCAPVCRNAVLE